MATESSASRQVGGGVSRVQRERAALAASLNPLDWRVLSWLVRYPFQRTDDLVVGLARWTSRATVYRHLHDLEQNALVGSVLPKTPAEGKRLYHLSNLGLHLVAAHLGTPARALARTWQTDEAGLLRLIPRLPVFLWIQDLVNGLVVHAADALAVQGRRPTLVRWNWQRDPIHHFRYREQVSRLLVDGALAFCVKTSTGDERWYGVLLLATSLEDEWMLCKRLERLLCWRECPERWTTYRHMLPVLVLAHSVRQRDHWHQAMNRAMQRVGSAPLIGAIACLDEGEQHRYNPWRLDWRTLATDAWCHLPDVLRPVPETALPPSLCIGRDATNGEGEGFLLSSSPAASSSLPVLPSRLSPLIPTHVPGYARGQKPEGQEKQGSLHERETLTWLTWQLTPMHWRTISLLFAHPLLSTGELAVFLHLHPNTARCVLSVLHQLGCILPVATTVGQRWRFGVWGLHLLAAANRVPVRAIATVPDDASQTEAGVPLPVVQRGVSWLVRHIQHTAGVYTFFVQLAQMAAQQPGHILCWWETGAMCERRYQVNEAWHNLRPDALADYQCGERHLQFWLEWDRGTMNVRDLTVKFTAYAQYLASREWERDHAVLPTLVCVAPELAQEQRILRVATSVLSQTPGLVLATTTQPLLAHDGPLATIWQVSQPQQRSQKERARRVLFTTNA